MISFSYTYFICFLKIIPQEKHYHWMYYMPIQFNIDSIKKNIDDWRFDISRGLNFYFCFWCDDWFIYDLFSFQFFFFFFWLDRHWYMNFFFVVVLTFFVLKLFKKYWHIFLSKSIKIKSPPQDINLRWIYRFIFVMLTYLIYLSSFFL